MKMNKEILAGTIDDCSASVEGKQVSPTCPKPNVSRRFYFGYTITNHGYYAPDKCIWWEAVNDKTGEADFHEHRLKDIIKRINEEVRFPNGG